MTSATTWNRIEPRVRGDSLSSLDARIYDPLWLLARQWQVGEFAAQDAGSPVAVTLQGALGTLSHLALGSARPGTPYAPDAEPLEAAVEAEPGVTGAQVDLRSSARAGLWWWAELDRNGLGSYRGQYLSLYPLPGLPAGADGASAATASVLAGRVCDGLALGAALAAALAGGALPAAPAFAADQQAAALAAAQAFVARIGATASPGGAPAAWAGTRLEYQASVGAMVGGREHALVAPEHRGGALDWHAFDLDAAAGVVPLGFTPPAGGSLIPASAQFPRSFQPQPARFSGMAKPRYWEFEDGNVNFGAVETGPTDLTRLLLIEYALVYGNDYFVVPLSLPVGTVCELDDVIVADTFGGTWSIPSVSAVDGANGGFKLFTHAVGTLPVVGGTPPAALGQSLLVPPTAASARAGRPLERVRFVRDEPAEMAWGIEETVQGGAGRPIQRIELQRELAQAELAQNPPPPPAGDPSLTYRLVTPPPAWWLPLVPEQTTTTAFALRVRELVDGAGQPQPPLGRILVADALLADEEVPRNGVEAQRIARRARWLGGRTSAWLGRRTAPARVEGSSGLTWDSVDPTP
jgi:hypothetical protein